MKRQLSMLEVPRRLHWISLDSLVQRLSTNSIPGNPPRCLINDLQIMSRLVELIKITMVSGRRCILKQNLFKSKF